MPINRQERILYHSKQDRVTEKVGIPSNDEGNNGDMKICRVGIGTLLFVKSADRWYNTATGQEAISPAPTTEEVVIRSSGGGGSHSSGLTVVYDSGWVEAINNSDITFTHNLNLSDIPKNISIYASDNSNPTLGTNTIVTVDTMNASDGVIVELTSKDVLEVHIGNAKLWDSGTFGTSSVPSSITDGYIRVIINNI